MASFTSCIHNSEYTYKQASLEFWGIDKSSFNFWITELAQDGFWLVYDAGKFYLMNDGEPEVLALRDIKILINLSIRTAQKALGEILFIED